MNKSASSTLIVAHFYQDTALGCSVAWGGGGVITHRANICKSQLLSGEVNGDMTSCSLP